MPSDWIWSAKAWVAARENERSYCITNGGIPWAERGDILKDLKPMEDLANRYDGSDSTLFAKLSGEVELMHAVLNVFPSEEGGWDLDGAITLSVEMNKFTADDWDRLRMSNKKGYDMYKIMAKYYRDIIKNLHSTGSANVQKCSEVDTTLAEALNKMTSVSAHQFTRDKNEREVEALRRQQRELLERIRTLEQMCAQKTTDAQQQQHAEIRALKARIISLVAEIRIAREAWKRASDNADAAKERCQRAELDERELLERIRTLEQMCRESWRETDAAHQATSAEKLAREEAERRACNAERCAQQDRLVAHKMWAICATLMLPLVAVVAFLHKIALTTLICFAVIVFAVVSWTSNNTSSKDDMRTSAQEDQQHEPEEAGGQDAKTGTEDAGEQGTAGEEEGAPGGQQHQRQHRSAGGQGTGEDAREQQQGQGGAAEEGANEDPGAQQQGQGGAYEEDEEPKEDSKATDEWNEFAEIRDVVMNDLKTRELGSPEERKVLTAWMLLEKHCGKTLNQASKAHRKLARLYHPDKNIGPREEKVAQLFRMVNVAWKREDAKAAAAAAKAEAEAAAKAKDEAEH